MDNNNFFSIDKLVEFGLGMAVANQMIGMMNQSMKQMYIPGSYMALPAAPECIYVAIENRQTGPLSSTEFNDMVNRRQVTKDTLAWLPGMTSWKPVSEVPELLKIIALTPPPLPNPARL
ncbi:MAG: DUF4339 domain-containing protein [Paramuribaculum sp.]|nr:DUF4339 domain-containing protein [Paramuribaculum sp.]